MADTITTAPEAATVTGRVMRDGYVAVKALVYAIARIQSLPPRWQEYSDMLDMCELVQESALSQSLIDTIIFDVERHVQHEVDLYPLEGMDKERAAMRARIDAMKAGFADALQCYNVGGEAA